MDFEELEEMDASEIHAKRLNAKEVTLPNSGVNYTFPVADGVVKPYGGDHVAEDNISPFLPLALMM